jgi:hypothetical protein
MVADSRGDYGGKEKAGGREAITCPARREEEVIGKRREREDHVDGYWTSRPAATPRWDVLYHQRVVLLLIWITWYYYYEAWMDMIWW